MRYRGLKGVRKGYRGLQGVTGVYRGLSLDTNIAMFLRYLEVFEKFRKKSDI